MIPIIVLFLDNLGGGELLIIFLFILLFFGSKNIPNLAKGMGKGMREFRNAMNDVKSDIEDSVKKVEEKGKIEIQERKKEEDIIRNE